MSENKTTYIKVAGIEVPIHLAWKKIETLNVGADLLERLNEKYPHLASEFTCEILPITRERIKTAVGDAKPPEKLDDEYIEFLQENIQTHSAEECIDLLRSSFNLEISLSDLVYFVGEQAYSRAMAREAELFRSNKILPEQTADLWNEAGLPTPGKAHWTGQDVEKLLQD